jgi:hypothetical protein
MAHLLNTDSTLQCPHGGSVSAITSNTKAKADGAFILRISDTFTIAGCAFTLPSGTPHPCMQVQWMTSTLRVKADGDLALAEGSVGMCLAADGVPQGTVLIASTQSKVQGQ